MKTGLAISVCIVAVAVGVRLIELREPTDQPTAASSSNNLDRFDLPDGLPSVYLPISDASQPTAATQPSYLSLAEACGGAALYMPGSDTQERIDHSGHLCQTLLHALASGAWPDGFIDSQIDPSDPSAESARQQFLVVQMAAEVCFKLYMDAGEYEQADAIARAQYEFGRRVFTQNVRLRARQYGLGLMQVGLQQVRQVAQAMYGVETIDDAALTEVAEDVQAWEDVLTEIESAWSVKIGAVTSGRPNVADLVRVAEQDADRSFRVFATHQLGYARFERGEPGNLRLLTEAIQDARSSEDPLVAAAGEASARLTREQFQIQPR